MISIRPFLKNYPSPQRDSSGKPKGSEEHSTYDLFVFAGERSGDLHGGKLLKALHEKNPSLRSFGVGGETMRKQPFHCFLRTEDFQVMGFVDVFFALPKLMKQFKTTVRTILENQPKIVVLIDYPGFNLRLAKTLKKKGYKGKVFHYICPSVWAWGKKRIPLMASCLDQLFSILPFEKSLFQHTSLHVEYVGHPLLATIAQHDYKPLEIPKGKCVIAIFPGSRMKELKRNLKILLETAKQLHRTQPNLYFVFSCSHPHFEPFLKKNIAKYGFFEENEFLIVDAARSYDLMNLAYIALAKSGTVTLELALHRVPTVVIYGISKIDLLIARDLLRIRLPYYSLPNILCQREVFPELFGPNLSKERLFALALAFLNDTTARIKCQHDCQELIELLGTADAHEETARIIENNFREDYVTI